MVAIWVRRALLGVAVAGLVSHRRTNDKGREVTQTQGSFASSPIRQRSQRPSSVTCSHTRDVQVVFPTARRDGWVRRGMLGPECHLPDLEADTEA